MSTSGRDRIAERRDGPYDDRDSDHRRTDLSELDIMHSGDRYCTREDDLTDANGRANGRQMGVSREQHAYLNRNRDMDERSDRAAEMASLVRDI